MTGFERNHSMDALRPIVKGRELNEIVLHNNASVGKTALTESFLWMLKSDLKDGDHMDPSLLTEGQGNSPRFQLWAELDRPLHTSQSEPAGSLHASTNYDVETVCSVNN